MRALARALFHENVTLGNCITTCVIVWDWFVFYANNWVDMCVTLIVDFLLLGYATDAFVSVLASDIAMSSSIFLIVMRSRNQYVFDGEMRASIVTSSFCFVFQCECQRCKACYCSWFVLSPLGSFHLNILNGSIFVLPGCDTRICDFENNSVSYCSASSVFSAFEISGFCILLSVGRTRFDAKIFKKKLCCFRVDDYSYFILFIVNSSKFEIGELFQWGEMDDELRVSIWMVVKAVVEFYPTF